MNVFRVRYFVTTTFEELVLADSFAEAERRVLHMINRTFEQSGKITSIKRLGAVEVSKQQLNKLSKTAE